LHFYCHMVYRYFILQIVHVIALHTCFSSCATTFTYTPVSISVNIEYCVVAQRATSRQTRAHQDFAIKCSVCFCLPATSPHAPSKVHGAKHPSIHSLKYLLRPRAQQNIDIVRHRSDSRNPISTLLNNVSNILLYKYTATRCSVYSPDARNRVIASRMNFSMFGIFTCVHRVNFDECMIRRAWLSRPPGVIKKREKCI
jgi:hypothetical protein